VEVEAQVVAPLGKQPNPRLLARLHREQVAKFVDSLTSGSQLRQARVRSRPETSLPTGRDEDS